MKINLMLAVAVAIALLLPTAKVQAGEINENEQKIVSAVSQSFVYNGQTYIVKDEYLAEGKGKLAQDDVNLSAAQAEDYISQFHGSYQELVEEGYCEKVEGRDAQQAAEPAQSVQSAEPEHSKEESQVNKVFLKTILGDAPDNRGKGKKDVQGIGLSREDGSGDGKNNQDTAANPAVSPAASPGKGNGEWAKEQDLGDELNFGDDDRERAENKQVAISGLGGRYQIKADADKEEEGEAGFVHGNPLSRLFFMDAWKGIFWGMAGFAVITIVGAFWYILKIRRHKKKRRRVRRWLAVLLGISFGGWALLILLVLGLYFGVYNNGAIQRQMMESDYFLGVTQMTRELAAEQLREGGYQADIASEVFTLSSVYIEEKQYIESVLLGKKNAAVSTQRIHDLLETEVVKEDGTSDSDMIDRLEETYCRMLQFEMGTVIYESRSEFMIWFYAVCIAGGGFLLAIFAAAYRMYGYLHKSARIAAVALLASSAFVTAGAFAARCLPVAEGITVSPIYYQQFLQKYVTWDINVLIYVGCLGILASVGMIIWKRYLHMVYAE